MFVSSVDSSFLTLLSSVRWGKNQSTLSVRTGGQSAVCDWCCVRHGPRLTQHAHGPVSWLHGCLREDGPCGRTDAAPIHSLCQLQWWAFDFQSVFFSSFLMCDDLDSRKLNFLHQTGQETLSDIWDWCWQKCCFSTAATWHCRDFKRSTFKNENIRREVSLKSEALRCFC